MNYVTIYIQEEFHCTCSCQDPNYCSMQQSQPPQQVMLLTQHIHFYIVFSFQNHGQYPKPKNKKHNLFSKILKC